MDEAARWTELLLGLLLLATMFAGPLLRHNPACKEKPDPLKGKPTQG